MTPRPITERERIRRVREQASRALRAIVEKREQEQNEAEQLKLEQELKRRG